ncbi:DUF1822 family protein [Cylindrospermum sp. FACHB-282]|uniref:DUF1822 family protein n=1 Tax=Cylindrospermum sp. FACHB-282 TaxID=2692794 RepID=UPI001687A77F|nr:DUF1822 family protein [Cylindrospermum sp. FACHB-282]MBD2388133.1 DUF1822 family protein [Cylindrospermum sp. FACHB-282]
MTLIFTEPTELLLEVMAGVRSQSWQNSQIYGTPHSRWCAYINQICLDVFLTWVKNEYVAEAAVWFSSAGIPSFWEFLNGVGICFGEQKVVLVPSEAIDHKELEVPQEWVDIPSWAADYYLAVQITNNQEWVRVWGYTTHQELKLSGNYDPVDRTYCLDARHITKDISAFFLTYQYCREAQTKKAIASLPELPQTQAENLVQRLGNPSVTFPRQSAPFAVWGALLGIEQSRQKLYQQRQAMTQINLSQWLKGIFAPGWQTLEAVFELKSNNNVLGLRNYLGVQEPAIKQAKLIDLGMQLESTSIVLLIALVPDIDRQFISVRVQLHPAGQEFYLPANIKLVLRSESGEVLQEVQARSQDNFVQLLRFDVETGVTFNIQVQLYNFQITENFIV